MKLADRKSALNPRGLFYWPFYGGGPGVSLTLCCFVVYSTRRFVLCFAMCYFVLVFFSPFRIMITSLRKARASPDAFHAFVQFALVWFCLFPLPLRVWEGLRFVIVALPGLFSYPFLLLWSFIVSFSHWSLIHYEKLNFQYFPNTYAKGRRNWPCRKKIKCQPMVIIEQMW